MTDTRHRTTLGSLFRFAVRLLGLTGVVAAAVGGVITRVEAPQVYSTGFWADAKQSLPPLVEGTDGITTQVGVILLLTGLGLAALWLVVELLSGLFLAAGRKSAEGLATLFLGVIAAAGLVVANRVSLTYYARIDCTRDQRFTLARELVDELKTLDPNTPTTVLVLQMDKTSAFDPELPDAITAAAQQKITEKVLDLIDELRQHPELSARFDVHVLDRKDERFEDRLQEITRDRPQLRVAVQTAPENSIFFASNDRVRRMPFSQFYLLDKTASRGKAAIGDDPNTAASNLVLDPQGKGRFVRALVGLERRKPKVGVLSIHPYLTSREPEEEGVAAFTAFGLRTVLERDGCEVIDVVVKKGWDGSGGLNPSAQTFEESKLDEVEAEYLSATEAAFDAELEISNRQLIADKIRTVPIAEVERVFGAAVPRGVRTDAEYREHIITRAIEPIIRQLRSDAEEATKQAAALEPEYRRLLADDRVQADRRQDDVTAKLRDTVSDCDLLVIPRYTTISLVNRAVIDPSYYPLADSQTKVVREFLTAGKPVLFALGPAPTTGGFGRTTDENEQMLRRLGIELGSQTVVTVAEAVAMRKPSTLGNRSVQLPPLELVDSANPVATAYDRMNRSVDGTLELKRSGYRPIYLAPRDTPFPYPPEVLKTSAEAWNESRPVPEPASFQQTRPYFPKFEPAKPDDPNRGTREEEKKRSFVVGVAVEVPVPAEWIDPKLTAVQAAAVMALGPMGVGFGPGVTNATLTPYVFQPNPPADPKTVRVAAFGHGGLFVGKELDPGQAALLLSTVNWQLGRDDHLPKDVPDAKEWRYPRVPLDRKQQSYWSAGGVFGLPLAVAVFGLVALMVRRRR